jgi:hypothetical protein
LCVVVVSSSDSFVCCLINQSSRSTFQSRRTQCLVNIYRLSLGILAAVRNDVYVRARRRIFLFGREFHKLFPPDLYFLRGESAFHVEKSTYARVC